MVCQVSTIKSLCQAFVVAGSFSGNYGAKLEESLYIPKFNEETDTAVLHSLIKSFPFGTWVTLAEGELIGNHLPFLLDEQRGEFGTLVAHVARANPVWKDFSSEYESLVVFQGNHSYITPSWYPTKAEHGKVVPTWNYTVVHAYGRPQIIEDHTWLRAHVTALTDQQESSQALPWKLSDAPEAFIDKLLGAIVGIEIPISHLRGKMKLGQNRSEADQMGVLQGLTAKGDDQSLGLADLLK